MAVTRKKCLVLIILLFSAHTQAGVYLEMIADDNSVFRIWATRNSARLQAEPIGYAIIDFNKIRQYEVFVPDKVVVDVTNIGHDSGHKHDIPKVKVELHSKGQGPEIAGYKTKHYAVKANGKSCFEEFLAEDVLKILELKIYIETVASLRDSQGPPTSPHHCDHARSYLDKQYSKLGFPMRHLKNNDEISREVVKINSNYVVSEDKVSIPKNYQLLDYQQLRKLNP